MKAGEFIDDNGGGAGGAAAKAAPKEKLSRRVRSAIALAGACDI
jgi:hypothetical protein